MSKRTEEVAASIGKNPEVAEKLAQLLKKPGDRAYIICVSDGCSNNSKGECTIYTILEGTEAPAGRCKNHRPA